MADPTVRILNPIREKPLLVKRSLSETQCYSIGAAGIPALAFQFDPSGTFGNFGAAAGPQGIADWAAFSTIYDQYKVKSITITMRLGYPPTTTAAVPYPVWYRYNYEAAIVTPLLNGVVQLTRCVEKAFTPTSPIATYKFYPRVRPLYDNVNVFSSEARGLTKMPWMDVNTPSELWGFQVVSDTALPASAVLYFECTYEILFKYNK